MTPVSVDASVAVKWFVQDVSSAQAAACIPRHELHAPSLILAETSNALWKYARRGDLSAVDCREALLRLPYVVRLESDVALAADAAALSIELDHPAYDCFYISLARRTGYPLLSADKRLLRKLGELIDVRFIDLATIPLENDTE